MLSSGGYHLYEDDVGQYDDEVNDVYDFMNRDIDERKNVPDEISAALKSLKRGQHWNYSKNILIFGVKLYF